jgi:hypothetical protein
MTRPSLKVLALPVIVLSLSARARAEEVGETLARQQLIKSAETAHKKGQHAEALDYALRAAAIRRSATLLSFIADEQTELERPVDAYATAQQCLHEAELDKRARLRDEAVAHCKALVTRLASHVGQVILQLVSPPPEMTVQINRKAVRLEVAGVPYLVAPGDVTIEASAPGYQPLQTHLHVGEGETQPAVIVMTPAPCPDRAPRAADGTCPALPIQPTVSTSSTMPSWTPMPAAAETSSGGMAARRWGWITGGAGVALLAGGVVAWAVADGHYKTAVDDCTRGCADGDRSDAISTVRTWDRLAGVGLVGGGALVVGGAALLLFSRPSGSAAGTLSVGAGPDATVTVRGVF